MSNKLTIVENRLRVHNGSLVLSADVPCCCKCCINSAFSTGVSGSVGDCKAIQYGQSTIRRPPCSGTGPVKVTIYGGVDDEFILNGEIIEKGLYPFANGCNGAHLIGGPPKPGSDKASGGHSFTLAGDTFTIAAGDNHGGGTGYDLEICFEPIQ